jgi:1,4-dihydroxy-6-naphthoate synthase
MAQPVTKTELLFSEIENAILAGQVDAGVIIHESRFTYQSKGLHKLIDLGEYWEQKTGLPVPLGGIAAHNRLDEAVIVKVNRCIRRSIEYANSNNGRLNEFIRCNAREMDEDVMQKHISLYVNDYSVSLGSQGKNAINQMFELACEAGIIKALPQRIFASV